MTHQDRPQRRIPRRARGMGMLLLLIIGFLVMMSVIAFSQRMFTSQVANQTSRSAWGTISMSLAESAIDETMNRIEIAANTPGSEVFDLLRLPVYANQIGDIDLTPHIKDLSALSKVLEEPTLSSFRVEEVTARVIYQRQFQSLPYERFGVIEYTARVGFPMSITETLSREVVVGKGFRVTLQSVPRPYDQPTFLSYLDDPPKDLKMDEVATSFDQSLGKVAEIRALAKAWFEHADTPGPIRDRYQQILEKVPPADNFKQHVREVPTEPSVVFAHMKPGVKLDLRSLDLAGLVRDRERELLEQPKEHLAEAKILVTDDPGGSIAHDRLAMAMEEYADGITELMKTYKEFYENWQFWVGDEQRSLARFRYKLGVDHWRCKAHYLVKMPNMEDSELSPIEKQPPEMQLKRILKMVSPLNGIVFVDLTDPRTKSTTGYTLTLDGSQDEFAHIRGNTIIAVQGSLHVKNINRDATDADRLVLVGIGGDLIVEGKVNAAVLSGDQGRLVLKPGSQVQGLVVADKMPSVDERMATVIREDKYYTGYTTADDDRTNDFTDYYYVAMSPRYLYKKVSR